ncbi:MAG: IclR family transcriptional regulator [Treponema sp.]|nr:IclR family transcriptional regulator [Treponema sp.]
MRITQCRGGGVSLIELSDKAKLNKNTAFQLLSTLLVLGYVEFNPKNKRYIIGYNALYIAEIGDYYGKTGQKWQPLLEELVRKTNETSHIAVLSGGKVRFIAKREASINYRVNTNLAELMSIHCSAVGKALIAFLPEDKRDFIIDTYIDYCVLAKNTITAREALIENLNKYRSLGFAVDDEESFDGVVCVAAPIYNIRGSVIASIGLSAPAVRVKDSMLLGEIVKKYAQKASEKNV